MICVSLTEKNPQKLIEIANSLEMVEVRIDLCELTEQSVASVFANVSKPSIATCRPDFCNNEKRMTLLKNAIVAGASYVDIEFESEKQYKEEMISFARSHSCKVIISYHNYVETPEKNALKEIVNESFAQGADIAKIATTANSKMDCARILSLYSEYKNIVALAMGSIGTITRVANLALGSPFSFASLDDRHATAAGQLTIQQMKNYAKDFNVA